MANILETQEVTGRCGTFSGDHRCSKDCHVWLATMIDPIIHSGEDYLRYTSSLPIWSNLLEALDDLNEIKARAHRELEAQRRVNPWRLDKNIQKTYYATSELEQKLGDAYRKAIYGLAKQAQQSREKMPVTSYVLHIDHAPGGVMYTDKDSLQTDAVEVCFPLSAGSMLYQHIAGVDLIKYHPDEQRYETVLHVLAEDLPRLRVKLPSVRKATAQAALNVYERLRPRLQDWISAW